MPVCVFVCACLSVTLSVKQSKQIFAMAEQRQEESEVSGLAWEMCLLVCMCVCVYVRGFTNDSPCLCVSVCLYMFSDSVRAFVSAVVCVVTGKYVGFFDHMC